MSFVERFSQIIKGDLIFVGNTLGLSKKENFIEAGTLGSIGAFSSLNLTNQVATFPKGTTLNYSENGSKAILNLPKDSEILYAELIWSGVYKTKNEDIQSQISKPISFTTSKGKYSIYGEYRTKQETIIKLSNFSLGVYVRSANVTTYVTQSKSGIYAVENVPSIISAIDENTSNTSFAGWTLAVVYKNYEQTPKKINLFVGLEPVYNSTISTNLSKFEIPNENLKAKLLLSCGEGDANIAKDEVYFGENESNLFKLKGPNNFENNFFASQINDEFGEIDKLGTFGDRNHNAKLNENVVAGRQGWDITTIDISKHIKKDFENSIVKFVSTGDLFIPNAIGLVVETSCANLVVKKYADKNNLIWGDLITYTIEIENVGNLETKNITLNECLPKSLTFMEHSIKIDNVSYSGKFPIVLSNLKPNEKHFVTFKMRVENSKCNQAKNIANVKYSYTLNDSSIVKDDSVSNLSCIDKEFENIKIQIDKIVNKVKANKNDILIYTTTIKNIGKQNLIKNYFYDKIPNNTVFVKGSVLIDNISYVYYNPTTGFDIGELLPNQAKVVKFKVKIV